MGRVRSDGHSVYRLARRNGFSGGWRWIKEKTKKHAGKATGNKRLQAKGKAGEVTGKIKLKRRKAKNAAKH